MNKSIRRFPTGVAVAAITIATGAATTGSAQASTAQASTASASAASAASAFPGFERVTEGVLMPRGSRRGRAVAWCPPRKVVIGGYGSVNNRFGQLMPEAKLTAVRPIRSRTGRYGFRVSARLVQRYDDYWSLQVVAFCADPISGYQWISDSTAYSTDTTQRARARCASGRSLLSVGGQIQAESGTVSGTNLQAFYPSQTHEGTAVGRATADTGRRWRTIMTGVCVPTPPGHKIVFDISPTDTTTPKSATARCTYPARNYGASASTSPRTHLHAVSNIGAPNGTRSWASADPGYRGNWAVATWTICAN